MDETEGGTKEFLERYPRSREQATLEDALAGLVEFVLTPVLVIVVSFAFLWGIPSGLDAWTKLSHYIFLLFRSEAAAALVTLLAGAPFVLLFVRFIEFKVGGLVRFFDCQVLAGAARWRSLAKSRPTSWTTGTLARFSDRWQRHIANRKAYAEKQKALSSRQKIWRSLRWWIWPL